MLEGMSPQTREWPTSLRRAAKVCLLAIYLLSASAGAHVTFSDEHSAWWAITLGVLAVLSGCSAAGLMLMERWMEERAAAILLALTLSIYATIATALGFLGQADWGSVFLTYDAAAAVGLRIVHLWAFDWNLNRAKGRAEQVLGPESPGEVGA